MQTETTRPAPYRVDAPIQSIETLEFDADKGYLIRHDFKPLNNSNVALLKQRENDTVRRTDKLPGDLLRSRNDSSAADKNLYDAIIQSGGWRPAGLSPYKDENLIPASSKSLYSFDEASQSHVPGWNELDIARILDFTVERKASAISNLLQCKSKNLPGKNIDFMFEKSGTLRIALSIGDPVKPTFKLLLDLRRPESVRRNRFRKDFWYEVEHTKGENAPVEAVLDLDQAIGLFDEHFATVVDDPEYSEVIFMSNEEGATIVPYSDVRRDDFVAALNPMFKVSVSTALMLAFTHTDRELQTR